MGLSGATYFYERASGRIVTGAQLPRRALGRNTVQYFRLGRLTDDQPPFVVDGRTIWRPSHSNRKALPALSVLFAHWLDNPSEYPDANEKRIFGKRAKALTVALLLSVGAYAQTTVSALSTDQPLLGWWRAELSARSFRSCGQVNVRSNYPVVLECDGKTVTVKYDDEVVTFDAAPVEALGDGRAAFLQTDGGRTYLVVKFRGGKVVDAQFRRGNETEFYYVNSK
jgi:hypothetical protein